MKPELPHIISAYINVSNAHDVEGILACFSDEATVRDENETLHGKLAIEAWIVKTIEKYDSHFEPLTAKQDENEAIVAVRVSGIFPGSPVTLDYTFTLGEGKILSLCVD